ncbi:hypothetical protein Ae706Ps2_3249c [Pseudonocardia sp. Ae706_Ps2]|nr:hypothetical protein Ae505Ps2_1996 [Pseudonocardia sp. Ae505_Ps2]OLM24816.1 hypothetical protein Ae706Ps2_3249c [Pseudonocardia sp. Ae706_Ps2]
MLLVGSRRAFAPDALQDPTRSTRRTNAPERARIPP